MFEMDMSIKKINMGAGYKRYPGYLAIDVDEACKPDFLVKNNDLTPLPQGHFNEILAWDVLEHIPHAHTMNALLDWANLLEVGGVLKIQTSYVYGIIDRMRSDPGFEIEFNWMRCMFGNQKHPGDFHFNGFTQATLWTYLTAAGFTVPKFTIEKLWLIGCEAVKTSNWEERVPPSEDAQTFVANAFQEILKRDAKPNELTAHANALAQLGRKHFLRSLISSPENLFTLGKTWPSEHVK
ncbi:hypothetical protein [Rhizobium hainanense]|uniref:Methyltransferase domain-containing protein n=1 Tax=Rhizobium hainanense TaxID=52131 RepID=A0A1C3UM95_9HYPH|nr:hypothetical protein [Rhizobium hainanense]SCB16578.1 hypothetical protein GA0061100_102637 [Rhizobium hainanense]